MSELTHREKIAILKKYGTCTITNRSNYYDELSLTESAVYWMQLKNANNHRPYVTAASTRNRAIDKMYRKIRQMMINDVMVPVCK